MKENRFYLSILIFSIISILILFGVYLFYLFTHSGIIPKLNLQGLYFYFIKQGVLAIITLTFFMLYSQTKNLVYKSIFISIAFVNLGFVIENIVDILLYTHKVIEENLKELNTILFLISRIGR